MTVVEVMVVVALGSVLLAMGGSLGLLGSRSFAAMGNYTDMDVQSRTAADLMSRDIRQATQVTGFRDRYYTKWLALTNTSLGTGVTYTWTRRGKTLVCQKTGQPDRVYLTECDRWDFDLFQRSPLTNGNYTFYPATNVHGSHDPSICKLINMTWKCSRSVLGNKENTESVHTAQIVLRNKQ
jgi:hypothetical protein